MEERLKYVLSLINDRSALQRPRMDHSWLLT